MQQRQSSSSGKRLTYPKAVDAVLAPAGFVRDNPQLWVRQIGDYRDEIDLQVSISSNSTILNFAFTNLVTADIVNAAAPAGSKFSSTFPDNFRVGDLTDNYDKWWNRSDPDGPAHMAAAIRAYVLPFLDGLHSLEGVKAFLQTRVIAWRSPAARLHLAVTQARLGDRAAALETLEEPPPKWWFRQLPAAVEHVENLKAAIRAL
jgi:hypothetical protein